MQRRTALISAGSLAAVVLTGATAVGANIGILSSADQSPIGDLSATAEVVTTEPDVVDVYLDDSTPTVTGSPTDTDTHEFSVDSAGIVEVQSSDSALRLGDVTPNSGWTWSSGQPADSELHVTFESDGVTNVFVAVLEPDGTITAKVDQPVVQTVPAAAQADGSHDEDDDDEHHTDDDHDDDEDEEREGRYDDD